MADGPEIQQPEQPQGRPQFGGNRRGPQQPQRPQGLFDLHGIGFSKSDACPVPVVPEVTITVDGQKLNIPANPIMSTNANGYTECNHYQLYGPLKANSKVQATCEKAPNAVKFEVSPVTNGRASVKATFNGVSKYFLIN